MRKILILMLLLVGSHAVADHPLHPVNFNPIQVDCLARNIYFEARGESVLGWHAVAHVTMNRVKSHAYPNNICDVVKQYKQFSWYSGPESVQINWYNKQEVISWRNIQAETSQFIKSYQMNQMVDPTGGALWYHASPMPDNKPYPYWAKGLKETAHIEGHKFYTR